MTSAACSARGSRPVPRHASRRAFSRAAVAALLLAPCIARGQSPSPIAQDHIVVSRGEPKFLDVYSPAARWPGTIHWRYNPASAPAPFVDTPTTLGVLQAAFDQWTAVCGVRHVYDGTTVTAPERLIDVPGKGLQPDLENVVGWGNPGISVAGRTMVSNDDDAPTVLLDADIMFSTTLVGDLGATAAHEFGHMIGLAHSNVNDQIMSGPPFSNYSGLARIQPDDVQGCRGLYGLPSGVQASYVCSLPPSVDFGSVTAGTTSAPQTVTMTNGGNAPLAIGTIGADDSQFARASGCDPGSALAPGASCTMSLTVRPNSIGGRSTTLVIGTTEGPYRVPLLADGTAPPPPPPVPTVTMVEYYNATLDHYFGTFAAGEQAILDAGNTPSRWTRTGQGYRVYPAAQAQASPLCRYYIPPALGDSHFFGRDARECGATAARNPSFFLEDAAFGYVMLPLAGACPTGTTPVYRVFSNRADANHRYTTDRATRDRMVALGWLAEGDGPDAVAMCAP